MLLLVAGRWLVGWCFPKRDLDILDDPIPDKLYCSKKKKGCIDNGESEKGSLDEADSSEPVANGGLHHLVKKDTDINISREVDRCELWKHMVHTLDKEPVNEIKARKNLSKKFEMEMEKNNNDDDSVPTFTGYKSTEI